MSGHVAPRDECEADFEAIHRAVMETERGRWFLQEFQRRNRHADTLSLVDHLNRIERAVAAAREPVEANRFKLDILEMSRAIARTRAEIAAMRPSGGDRRIAAASGELDTIVAATEAATSSILAAAEQVQEAAWTLRERQADPAICDALDQHAVAIYTACSFQDLTAQRTANLVATLRFLEDRVNAMADIWDLPAPTNTPHAPDATNDDLMAMSQADVDDVLDVAAGKPEAMGGRTAGPDVIDIEKLPSIGAPSDAYAAPDQAIALIDVDEAEGAPTAPWNDPVEDAPPAPSAADDDAERADIDALLFGASAAVRPPASRPSAAADRAEAAIAAVRRGGALTREQAEAALDALQSMSVEERTRLFS